MAVFVELTTDPFEETREKSAAFQRARARSGSGARNVRRPTRGLEVKAETPAILKVIGEDGTPISLTDSGRIGEEGQGYGNFLLQTVSQGRAEKHQIVETFGESYVYFFGAAPRFLDVTAVLVNSRDFPWPAEWWENYEQHFRGTRLAERGARSYLFFDDNIVEAYMLNCQATSQADSPHVVQLSFRLFVTHHQTIRVLDVPQPSGYAVDQPPSLSAAATEARLDEYTAPTATGLPNAALAAAEDEQPILHGGDELPGFVSDSSRELAPYGANIDNPDALTELGMGAPAATGASDLGFAATSDDAGTATEDFSDDSPLARVFGASMRVEVGSSAGSTSSPPASTTTREAGAALEPFAIVALPGQLVMDADERERRSSAGGLSEAVLRFGLTDATLRAQSATDARPAHTYERRQTL